MKKKGIDISKHQGNINFDAVSKEVDFVILREGYGVTVDPKFDEYVKGCIDNGINIPAVYHFSYAKTAEQAAKEAEICVNNLNAFGCPAKIIFYDFEYDTVKTAKRDGVILGPKQCQEFTKAFCEKVNELGYIPGVYCNKDYYKNWYTPEIISSYILWLADYSGEPDYPCAVQQTSSTGRISGINSGVDLDIWFAEELFNTPKIGTAISQSPDGTIIEVPEDNFVNKNDREIAEGVIAGKYGNGEERKKLLGDRYDAVQKIVNEMLKDEPVPTSKNGKVAYAQSRDNSLAGNYEVTCASLYVRFEPGKINDDNVVRVIKQGERVRNYGYFTNVNGTRWLYIQLNDKTTGFINSKFVKKI